MANDHHKLPKEFLLKVFGYLNFFDLRSCMLTCRTWKEAITHNPETMKHFPLILSGVWGKNNEVLCCIDRSFDRIHISDFSGFKGEKEACMDVLNKLGSTVRELELWNCTFDDGESLTATVNALPNLEKLILISTNFRTDSKHFQQTDPKKLTSLVMIESDFELLYFLMNAQLVTFKVKGSKSYHGYDKPLFKFLSRQHRLKSFALRSVSSDNIDAFTSSIPATVPYKLQHLSLLDFNLDFDDKNEGVDENFLQFLSRQCDSVEILEIGEKFNDLVYQFVLGKFKKLHTVHLHVVNIPKTKEFYHYAKSLEGVKKLIIEGDATKKIEILSGVFDRFPNIETLVLKNFYIDRELIRYVADNMKQLKHLSIPSSNSYVFEKVKFKQLLSFHCDIFQPPFNWEIFTKNNPKLEKISIKIFAGEESKEMSDIIASIAKNLKNLKHLKLGQGMKVNAASMNILRVQCRNLKTFESLQSSIPKSCENFEPKTRVTFYDTIYSAFNDEEENGIWAKEEENYFEVTNKLRRAESYDENRFNAMFGIPTINSAHEIDA